MSFAADTALEPLGDGRFRGTVDERWWVQRGPFGGFVTALLARALCAVTDWPPRSLAVHFVDAPVAGPIQIVSRIERAGRSSSTVSLRAEQEGHVVALALATAGEWRDDGDSWLTITPPAIAPPDECIPIRRTERTPPFFEQLDIRWGEGFSFINPGEAYNASWVSVREPLDAVAVAALADVWNPPAFGKLGRPAVVPTLDLAVHFRAPVPAGEEWVLASHRSEHAGGGTWTCDGTLWTRDGVLLAQVRQLALLRG